MRYRFVLPLLGVVLLAWAAVWWIADLNAVRGQRVLQQWESGQASFSRDAWDRARDRLLRASRLNRVNAQYRADLGRLFEFHARQFAAESVRARELRHEELRHLRSAAELRPAWAPVWAEIATTKALMQPYDLDQEFFHALERAMDFGVWEAQVQYKVIWAGMVSWNQLHSTLQDRLKAIVLRVLEHNWPDSLYAIEVAVQTGWESQLRPLLSEPWQVGTLELLLKKRGKRRI